MNTSYVKLVGPDGDTLFPAQELPRLPAAGDVVAWDVDLVVREGPVRWERLGVVVNGAPRWVAVLVADPAPRRKGGAARP